VNAQISERQQRIFSLAQLDSIRNRAYKRIQVESQQHPICWLSRRVGNDLRAISLTPTAKNIFFKVAPDEYLDGKKIPIIAFSFFGFVHVVGCWTDF
jgi:hypothetical protein